MKKQKSLTIIGINLLVIFLTFFLTRSIYHMNPTNKIHILKAPLSIGSEKENNYYMLPTGTYLYLDSYFAEGFARYSVYVNIKPPLDVVENTAHVEAPLSADVIDKSQLINLLKNVKLDKEDIKAIILYGKFSDEDKNEINNFLQQSRS